MGSVKDLEVLKKPELNKTGHGRFIFSDRYSVFDWGEMPDLIPHKGEAIAVMAAHFFERAEGMGIPTHYKGLVTDGECRRLKDTQKPANTMEVDLLRVIKPGLSGDRYDYSDYRNEKSGFLIPLEVIYRNYLPAGSSVFKRLESGSIDIKDLGLKEKPSPGQKLQSPIIDVSTKLEITDRYITWDEARDISSLTEEETGSLKKTTSDINDLITDEFSRIGLINEDGKIEYGFDLARRIMIVDVFGTLDECRFTHNQIPVSKEIARIFYRNSEWYGAVEEAKKKDRQNWKEVCRLEPENLPPELVRMISHVYCASTNEITGRKWFDVPGLKEVLQELKGFLS